MAAEVQAKSTLIINVGSRNSQLALIQTNLITEQLERFYENNPDSLKRLNRAYDEIKFNVISMTTTGDQILDKALPDIGAKSLFTKELEVALLDRKVDFIVHSLKDLPTTLPEGCAIGAIWKRDDPEDVLVVKKSLRETIKPLDIILERPTDGRRYLVGTSSQRRIAMLRHCNPELECANIRGNLNTRLAKLDNDDGEYSAIILAKAGLVRMNWSDRASVTLTPEKSPRLSHWCYAVGQGALAVECRTDDELIKNLLTPMVDFKTTYEAVAERSLMRKLEGGCSVPLGVRSIWLDESKSNSVLKLNGIILSLDGKRLVEAHAQTELNQDDPSQLESKLELMTKTTGVVIPNQVNDKTIAVNLIRCADLGITVATKMIESGCFALMSCDKD